MFVYYEEFIIFAKPNTKIMMYSKEEMMGWSFKRLIDTIMDLQQQLEDVDKYQKAVEKITRIVETTNSDCDCPEGYKRGGRRKYTPEEKAAAYERQKERQRERYRQRKERLITIPDIENE